MQHGVFAVTGAREVGAHLRLGVLNVDVAIPNGCAVPIGHPLKRVDKSGELCHGCTLQGGDDVGVECGVGRNHILDDLRKVGFLR